MDSQVQAMTRREAERLMLTRVADAMEGLGFGEFFHFSEDAPELRAEFEALIKELRRRGTALEGVPKKDS